MPRRKSDSSCRCVIPQTNLLSLSHNSLCTQRKFFPPKKKLSLPAVDSLLEKFSIPNIYFMSLKSLFFTSILHRECAMNVSFIEAEWTLLILCRRWSFLNVWFSRLFSAIKRNFVMRHPSFPELFDVQLSSRKKGKFLHLSLMLWVTFASDRLSLITSIKFSYKAAENLILTCCVTLK